MYVCVTLFKITLSIANANEWHCAHHVLRAAIPHLRCAALV